MGGLLARLFLVVVDRQPLIARADEHVEEAPGAAREAPKLPALGGLEVLGAGAGRGPAHPAGELGGEEPEQEHRRGGGERRGPQPEDEAAARERQQGRGGHSPPEHGAPRPRRDVEGRVGGARPLEQVPAGDHLSHQRAADRVDHHRRLVGGEGDRQGAAPQALEPHPAPARERGQEGRDEERQRPDRQRQRAAGQPGPGEQEEGHQQRAEHAAAEVVGDLPAVDQRELVRQPAPQRGGHPGQQPRQQLPVAAHPAVHAHRVAGVVGRVALEEDDVGRERGSPVDALEEVVADERVLGHAVLHAPHEGIDLVDALADVDAGAEQVLVQLGARVGVDVEADVAREQAREDRRPGARRRRLDARLHDGVAGDDAAGARLEDRPVEGVREQAHQAVGAPHRQLGVAVEGDHEAGLLQALGVADVHRVAGLGVSAEQAVELLQLAPLALPAHVTLLGRVPPRRPVEEVKGAPAGLPVPGVEGDDPALRALEE